MKPLVFYPGHPITLAWCIINRFPDLSKALEGALQSSDIPGAGGNVHRALDVLKQLHSGMPFDTVVKLADQYWDECDGQMRDKPLRWGLGQDEANQIKPLLQEKVFSWLAQSSVDAAPARV